MRDRDRLAGAAREGERRPLAVLRWCNAIACHFFYALCFSCVERVERVSRKAASSLFHARENATNLNFFEVASPRPPVHAESRLVRRPRVFHNARRGDGTEGHETRTPRARARARVLRGDVRAPPPRRAHRAPAAAVPRVRAGFDFAHPVSQLAGLLAPLAAPGGGRAGRARGPRASQGGCQGPAHRGPLRVQRAAGAGEPAFEGGGDRARERDSETGKGGCL